MTAGTVFANPIPALNLVAGAAVQLDMMADLARIYGLEPSSPQLRTLAGQMVQAMLKVGLIEAATSVVAGIFKRTPLSFAAAGAVQAVTMAYLVRIAGKALTEYLPQRRELGRGGDRGRAAPPVRAEQPLRVPPGLRPPGRRPAPAKGPPQSREGRGAERTLTPRKTEA